MNTSYVSTSAPLSIYRRLASALLLWLIGTWSTVALAATEPDTHAWITNGTVHAIARFGSIAYLGGDFNYIGPNTGYGASLDARNGQPQTKFARLDGGTAVYAAVPDGAGGWFVGGDFTRAGTAVRTNLVHLTSSGAVDETFSPDPNGTVYALAYDSEAQRLYVGGTYSEIGGVTRRSLAAINTATGAVTGWDPALANDGANRGVYALVLATGGRRLFVGGDFSAVAGDASAARLVTLNTFDGAVAEDWNSASHTVGNGAVRALALDEDAGTLYLAGSFTVLGGNNRNRLGAVSSSTGTLQNWNPNADGAVNALALDTAAQRLYAGGEFTSIGGVGVARLAQIDTEDAAVAATWEPNPDDTVHALALVEASGATPAALFVGGDFDNIGGADPPQRVQARLSLDDGTAVTTWKPRSRGVVRTMAMSSDGSSVYIGGIMSSNGGQARNNLASVLTVNGAPTAWAPEVTGGSVRALAVTAEGSRLYIAGDFTEVGDAERLGIARLGTDPGDPTAWEPDNWYPEVGAGGINTLALAALGANVRAVAIHPTAPRILYAGTEKGLYKSNDNGLNWSRIDLGVTSQDVRALLIDPNTPSTLYAGTFGSGVLKSTDSGANWVSLNQGLSHLEILSLAILPDSSMLFAGNAGASGVDTGLFTLAAGEETWQVLLTGEMRNIAVDRRDDNYVYIAAPDGIWRWSRKDGRTAFTRIIRGLAETSVRTIVSTTEAFTCAGEEYTRLYASSGAIVYRLSCEVDTDPATGRPVERDGEPVLAVSWILRRTGLPAGTITALLLHPQDESSLYAATLTKGIFKTEDAGREWRAINDGLHIPTLYSLAMAPSNPDIMFAGAALGFGYRTTDGGANWVQRSTGIPTDILYAGGEFQGAARRYLAALATAPDAADYFGNWDAQADGPVHALRLSSDSSRLFVGGAFTQLGGGAHSRVAVLRTDDATATGFSASVDDGEVRALAVDAAEQTMYLGGTFTSVNSRTRRRLAAVSITEGSVTSWNPGSNGEVNALMVTNLDNLVVAAGTFTSIGGEARRYLASLRTDLNNNNATDWSPDPDAAFPAVTAPATTFPVGQALAADSRDDALDIFVGGGFTTSSNLRTRSLAVYRFTPPRVKVDPRPQAYNEPQRITLECIKTVEEAGENGTVRRDTEDEKCRNNIYYTTESSLDEATWQRYTAPIDFDATIDLSYYAVFDEGMRSPTVTGHYVFDTTSPRVTSNMPSGTYSSTRVVNLSCEDGQEMDPSVSQCAVIYYTLDGSTPQFAVTTDTDQLTTTRPLGSTKEYASFVPVIADAELKFIAVDSAGNASPVNSETYRIERGEGSGALSLGALAVLVGWGARRKRRSKTPRRTFL